MRRLHAKDRMAAVARRAVQREVQARAADRRRDGGVDDALWFARSRMKVTASSLQRPPISIPIRVLDFVRFFLGFVFSLMENLPLPMVSNLNLFFLINVQWLFGSRLHFHSILQPLREGVEWIPGKKCKFDLHIKKKNIALFLQWNHLLTARLSGTTSPCLRWAHRVGPPSRNTAGSLGTNPFHLVNKEIYTVLP